MSDDEFDNHSYSWMPSFKRKRRLNV